VSKGSKITFAEATREAELGAATCRNCDKKGPLSRFVTVLFGGGLVYTVCPSCLEQGTQILVRHGPGGIEVLSRGNQKPLIVGAGAHLDVLKKRIS
jgi:hypothetical protein